MSITQSLTRLGFKTLSRLQPSLRGSLPPLAEMHSFLLLEFPSALGTAVHTAVLVPALRAAVPDAEIVVCASGFALDVLRNHAAIDRLVATPDPARQLLGSVRAIRAALPVRRPFATLTSTASMRSAVPLAATLAGAANLVGFSLRPEVFRAPLVYKSSLSQIANNLRIIETLGHAPIEHCEPQMFFAGEDLAYARTLIQRFDQPTRRLGVLVTQTSPTQRKSWRPERFVAAARHLIERHQLNLLLVGAVPEREMVGALRREIGACAQNVAGETSLPQLAALLSLCTVGLTLDSGILHVGRAVRLPMVVIAPAWSPPVEWLPLDNPRYVLLKNLDLPVCPPDYIIDEVSLEEVTSALDGLIAAYPYGAAS